MADAPQTENTHPGRAGLLPWAPLEAFTLGAFAISQPLYSLLGANATFFAANGVDGAGIVWFALGVLLVPGAVLVALDLVVVLFGGRHARTLHACVLGSLGALAVGVPVLKALNATGVAYLAGVVVAAAGFSTLVARLPTIRQVVRWASFAPPVFLVLFLCTGQVSGLRSGAVDATSEPTELTGTDTSVVMLVFDQLPLSLIVTPSGQLDAERFPGFARLAAQSTWYREATTILPKTDLAVPSMLTGRVPDWDALPVLSTHPDNLFTELAGSHDVYADEYVTQLCPDALCGEETQAPSTIVEDTTAVLVRVLLDERSADALVPRVDGRWNDFGGGHTVTGEARSSEEVMEERRAAAEDSVRFGAFLDQLGGIGDPERPDLAYLHLFQPHEPFRYLPDGRQHNQGGPFATDEGIWPENPEMMDARLQHYLAQAMNADREVSEVLDRIESDRDHAAKPRDTIIVVTSDHGVGMAPGMANKLAEPTTDPTTLTEQMAVPLFVSVPGSAPAISDSPVQLTDVLPTVLDALGADPARMELDGVPAGEVPAGREPVLLTPDGPRPIPPRGALVDSPTPPRVAALMPVAQAPWAFGPAAGRVGSPAPATSPDASPATASVPDLALLDAGAADGVVPAVVNATLAGPDAPVDVLVVLDDVVVGGARTFAADGRWHLSALVEPGRAADGSGELRLLHVTPEGFREVDIA